MDYLSIGAIAKDEAPYLPEWVEFHRLVGVERFYLYDNGGPVPIRETLKRQIAEGVVHVIDWPGVNMHIQAYGHCVANYGKSSRWIAFIDIDEFLCPTKEDDLRVVLKEFEPYGALLVNWLMFGSGDHLEKPPGLQIESFLMRQPETTEKSKLIKTIVRPEYVCATLHTHCFGLRDGVNAVNEKCQVVPYGPRSVPNSVEKLRLNHYFTRSRAEFLEKTARGRSDGTATLTVHELTATDALCTVEDRTILRFVPRLKAALEEVVS